MQRKLSLFISRFEKENIIGLTEMASGVRSGVLVISFTFLLALSSSSVVASEGGDAAEPVLTLDSSNFSDIVSKHDFVLVEFYAPWCGHCKKLAPEYEKAASELSSHDPPIILAKVDANEATNAQLREEYGIQGFPTLKIFRNGGKNIQEYKGPRDAGGIISYLKKQVGPPSVEIKTAEDAKTLIDEKNIFIVGVFPGFSGEEYLNFTILAEKLRSDYSFGHTLDAKVLPRGDVVNAPTLRLLKPFDELFVDFQDFQLDSMETFIEEATVPTVTIFNLDESNYEYVNKFFNSLNAKAMLFLNFSQELDSFKHTYNDVAALYKGKGVSFLMGDVEASQRAFQYFGLKEDQAPLIIIQNNDGTKYLKANLAPDEIAPWLKNYKDGNLTLFVKSEPIPKVNEEPVKVVVRDNLQEIVFNSGKNVFLEFYAPWCGHCKQLAPTLDEVAKSFVNDHDVVIAKLDATANDVPKDIFDVQGFPTLYFISASGNLLQYDGGRTKEEIIDFIQKNQDKPAAKDISKEDLVKSDLTKEDASKDEL